MFDDDALSGLDTMICYAMKANANQAILRTFLDEGAGLDVVSRKANCAGRWRLAPPPTAIVFAGVGKTAREIAFALDTGIACFNVESEPELALISEIATARQNDRTDRHPGQSRRRRQNPCQDHHRPGGEQVWHPL